jgi:hypothetical protein
MSTQKCIESGCTNNSRARGYCAKHYKYFRYHEKIRTGKECVINECTLSVDSNDLCKKHYRASLKYKITTIELNNIFKASNGLCEICNQKCSVGDELSIDHDHVTGNIRGMLCRKCNAGIGLLQDSSEIILKAYNYISSYQQ